MKGFLAILFMAVLSPAATFDEVAAGIRANKLTALSRDDANATSKLGWTPLHYAALYGSVDATRALLDAHADPNAPDSTGATPLIYAAWSFARARLLVDHGATVQVADKQGITPLMVASTVSGNLPTVRLLLDHGADARAVSQLGENALLRAARFGDNETVRLLLEHGADPKAKDRAGFTPLLESPTGNDPERVRLLLQAGSDPNAANVFAGRVKNGPIALVQLTPLMLAAPHGSVEIVRMLLKAGARVNETDSRKMTPLMLAIATDQAKPETVRLLLQAGADVKPADIYGETALDWARKFNNPEIVHLLEAAGATGKIATPEAPARTALEPVSAQESIGRATKLFAQSDFFRAGGGCSGCHHQPMHARAAGTADPHVRQNFRDAVLAMRPAFLNGIPTLSTWGGDYDVPLSIMAANADLEEPASLVTDAMVHFLAARQSTDGSWRFEEIARPPLEESAISRTAGAVIALSKYGFPSRSAEWSTRIAKARQWLTAAKPITTYEHADRILGLRVAGVSAADLRPAAQALLQLQKPDGGWAQTMFLESDAYGTGLVLDTLFKTGLLAPGDPAYRRGVAYLLKTQYPDGSWFVRSRAPKFQPYFQSGFPFDHDQWISSVGTAWATMALRHTEAPVTLAHR